MYDTIKFKCAPIIADTLRVTSGFGERALNDAIEPHKGIDIAAIVGTPIVAVADGTVLRLVDNATCGVGVVLVHDELNPNNILQYGQPPKFTTAFCHALRVDPTDSNNPKLKVGDTVKAGQIIGYVGMTGRTFGPHLHFILKKVVRKPDAGNVEIGEPDKNVFREDIALDPLPYIQSVFSNIQLNSNTVNNRPVEQPPVSSAAISPFIEALESFHPKIQYELTRRRISSETANSYMPFVKLTSLSVVPKQLIDGTQLNNLPDSETEAYCPSLGIHGEDNVSFDDIYSTKSNRSIVAYGVSTDGNRNIPILVADASKDARNIPIPGITQITAERSTAGPMGVRGGLLKADLKIVAYSVGQVDALLRYFLRPATRVVLELGRKSSNPKETPITTFDWKKAVKGELEIGNRKADVKTYFSSLIKNPEYQKDFIKKYIYDNHGNYEVFIAYVVKFNLKYNKNNTFEIDLTVHSVQQVEIPTKHTGVQSTCSNPTISCKVMDVQEYFNDAYSWKDNHFARLISYYREVVVGNDVKWRDQIIPIRNNDSNQNQNDVNGNRTSGAASTNAGTRENEYFVSWRFFVEKILNDRVLGIASMLGNNKQALLDLAVLRAVKEPNEPCTERTGLISNQVGYHPNLRSVNPGVMLINNPVAQQQFLASRDNGIFTSLNSAAAAGDADILNKLQDTSLSTRLETAIDPFSPDSCNAGASYLTRGIWINTTAIKQAFTSADTVSSGINSLLTMMNSATEGYWNLQLYSTDVNNPGMHVIDMGLSKAPKLVTSDGKLSIDAEDAGTQDILNTVNGVNLSRYQTSEDKPKYIYMFNRGTKKLNDGELGSDIIDLNVEFNMPQVIAVQAIANIGGPAQKSTLQAINVEELRQISLIKDLYTPCRNEADDDNCESDEIQRFRKRLEDAQEQLKLFDQRQETLARSPLYGEGAAAARAGEALARDLSRAPLVQRLEEAQLEYDTTAATEYNPNLVSTVREYADLGTALKLMEINPSRMMKQLNLDSVSSDDGRPSSKAHAFNSSNLTKTVVDVTLPGIGGINLFQSFLVDRIPSIINRGFYVVTKIVHEFSSQNGWTTKVQGRFRFRPDEKVAAGASGTSGTAGTSGTSTPTATAPATATTTSPVSTRRRSSPTTLIDGQSMRGPGAIGSSRNTPTTPRTTSNNTRFDPFRNPFQR
jgi:hypothetical protein